MMRRCLMAGLVLAAAFGEGSVALPACCGLAAPAFLIARSKGKGGGSGKERGPEEKEADKAACPKHPPYGGFLFDAMTQVDARANWEKAVREIRKAGVGKVAIFARSLDGLGEFEEELLVRTAKHPGLFVLGAPKFFLLRDDLTGGYIEATLEGVRKHRYAFVGEIMYTHGDKSHGEQTAFGERYVDPAAPGTARLLSLLKPLGIPLMTHWEVYAWERDHPRFERLYRGHPSQVFILPHMGFATAAQAREMLAAHPNLYMTISKKDGKMESFSDASMTARVGGPVVDGCRTLLPEWKSILIGFHGRLLFATDAHKERRWREYARHVRRMRQILGQLPDEAARDIAYRNAARLYRTPVSAP